MSRRLPRRSAVSTVLALALAALAECGPLAVDAAAQLCGDVDANEKVNAGDALRVLRAAVGQQVELLCTGDCGDLDPRVTALEADLAGARADLDQAKSDLEEVQALLLDATETVEGLATLLAGVTRDGDTLTFSGMNVQVVDGSGDTAGTTNGLGNLVVGYNEATADQARGGSHNLVLGREHEYTSFGGIVAGQGNSIAAPEASVLGGRANEAKASYSTVVGGNANAAEGLHATVGGGFANVAKGQMSAISGGCENVTAASTSFSSVSGGQLNEANANWSAVTGGYRNKASGQHAGVSGGANRSATGPYDWKAGDLAADQ